VSRGRRTQRIRKCLLSAEFVLRAVIVILCRESIDGICPHTLAYSETLFAGLVKCLKKVKSDVNVACLFIRKKLGIQWRYYQEVRAKTFDIYHNRHGSQTAP
jgi:hypothetical protein